MRALRDGEDPAARARVAELEADVRSRREHLVRQVEMADEFAALLRAL